ncbi:MAG: DUF885 domain-containing protein [bacterium]|nr:DUF885 domain-containing protein [bacterium]
MPGQAASYFCGATRANELRAEVELLLGLRFRRRDYHDCVLAQGLVPFSLLRQRVTEELVPRSGQKLALEPGSGCWSVPL